MEVNKASDDNEMKENKACDVTRTFTAAQCAEATEVCG